MTETAAGWKLKVEGCGTEAVAGGGISDFGFRISDWGGVAEAEEVDGVDGTGAP